jgi:methylglutaconyl-CoA hydratase
LTAETLTAAMLKELGLVHEVVPAGLLDASCARITESLLQGAPQALAEAKQLIRDVAHTTPRDRAAASLEAAVRLARLRVQAEAQEGFSAFFARRKASWRQD